LLPAAPALDGGAAFQVTAIPLGNGHYAVLSFFLAIADIVDFSKYSIVIDSALERTGVGGGASVLQESLMGRQENQIGKIPFHAFSIFSFY